MAHVALMVLALGGCGRRAGRAAAAHRVVIAGLRFNPETLAVAPGDTVEWENRDIVPHTATDATRSWDTDTLPPHARARIPAPPTGTYSYGCRVHPAMHGTLIVRAH
jgi:plastocyanin